MLRKLWIAGAVAIATLGQETLDNDEVQEVLVEIAALWTERLGKALGELDEEDIVKFRRLHTRMRATNAEAREMEKR